VLLRGVNCSTISQVLMIGSSSLARGARRCRSARRRRVVAERAQDVLLDLAQQEFGCGCRKT
jgi:hypothetical protein